MLCTSVIFDDHSLIVSALSAILIGQERRSTKGCFRMGRVWSSRLTVPDRPGIEILLILRWGCQHSSYGIMDALKLSTGFKFPLPIFRFVDILKGRDQNLRCRSARMPSNCLSRDITSLPQPFDMNDVMEADERNSQYMNVFKTVNLLALQ